MTSQDGLDYFSRLNAARSGRDGAWSDGSPDAPLGSSQGESLAEGVREASQSYGSDGRATAPNASPPLQGLQAQWASDDRAAADWAERKWRENPLPRVMRWTWIAGIVTVLAALGLVVMTPDRIWLFTAATAGVVTVGAVVAEAGARDAQTRAWRRMTHEWLDQRDPGQLERGLPPLLMQGWTKAPVRLLNCSRGAAPLFVACYFLVVGLGFRLAEDPFLAFDLIPGMFPLLFLAAVSVVLTRGMTGLRRQIELESHQERINLAGPRLRASSAYR